MDSLARHGCAHSVCHCRQRKGRRGRLTRFRWTWPLGDLHRRNKGGGRNTRNVIQHRNSTRPQRSTLIVSCVGLMYRQNNKSIDRLLVVRCVGFLQKKVTDGQRIRRYTIFNIQHSHQKFRIGQQRYLSQAQIFIRHDTKWTHPINHRPYTE